MKTALLVLATVVLTSTQVFAAISCALSRRGPDGQYTKIIWQGEVSRTERVTDTFTLFIVNDRTILTFKELTKMMNNIRSIEDSRAVDRMLEKGAVFTVGPVISSNPSIAEHMSLSIGKLTRSDEKQPSTMTFVKPAPFISMVDDNSGIAVACSTESLDHYLQK